MSELADLLLRSGDIEFDQLESVRSQQEYRGGRLEHILVENRMVKEAELTSAIARVTGVEKADLERVTVDKVAMSKLDGEFCLETPCFPLVWEDPQRTLTVAVTDPTDIGLIDAIIQKAGCRVRPMVAGLNELRAMVRKHYLGESVDVARAAVPVPEGDEFKVTDMSGKTLMTSLQALKEKHDAEAAAIGSPPPPPLNDLADSLFRVNALSPEELQRLEKVRINTEKSGIIISAILELLEEKGVLTRDEVESRTD